MTPHDIRNAHVAVYVWVYDIQKNRQRHLNSIQENEKQQNIMEVWWIYFTCIMFVCAAIRSGIHERQI